MNSKKHRLQQIGKFIAAGFVLALIVFSPLSANALNATDLASAINSRNGGNDFIATVTRNTVTVTNKSGPVSGSIMLEIGNG